MSTPSHPLNPLASSFSPSYSPVPPPSSAQLWSKKLFSLQHIPELQKIYFHAPVLKGDNFVAVCSKTEVDRTAETWKDALHGCFAGRRPYLPVLLTALDKAWRVKGSYEVFPRPDESFIITFSSLEDRSRILDSGPWFVLGRYMHIRPWSRFIRSKKEFFATLPIWIRLPNLPLHLWSPGSIGKIVSVIGKPLFLDEKSSNSSKLQFVRVCVEVSACKPLPSSVKVEVEGGNEEDFEQPIEYESLFKICSKCNLFGHSVEECAAASRMPTTLKRKAGKKPLEKVSSSNDSLLKGVPASSNQDILPISATITGSLPSNLPICKPVSTVLQEKSEWTIVSRKKKKKKKKKVAGDNIFSGDRKCLGDRDSTVPDATLQATGNSNLFSDAPLQATGNSTALGDDGTSALLQHDAERVLQTEKVLQTNLTAANLGELALVDQDFVGSGPVKTCPRVILEPHQAPCFEVPLETQRVGNSSSFSTQPSPTNLAFSNPIPIPITPLNSSQNPTTTKPSPNSVFPSSNLLSHPTPRTPSSPTLNQPMTNPTSRLTLDQTEPNPPQNAKLPSPTSDQTQDHAQFAQPVRDFSEFEPNPTQNSPTQDFYSDESSEDEDGDLSFPPGFTPSKEDLLTLKELMKEGASLVPPEYQKDFVKSVDLAEDGEILEFFQEKFKESVRASNDTNYVTFHNVRRSPRMRKTPARLTNSCSSSGLKKGFLK